MNSLIEYPHLFANGEFKVNIEEYTAMEDDIWPVVGIVDQHFFLEKYNGCKLENFQLEPEHCSLIARPIEDMTDQECTGSVLFECLRDKAEPKYIRKELIEMNYLRRTMRLSLYLLSIGVYPFDQSHFEDGTVIDINKK